MEKIQKNCTNYSVMRFILTNSHSSSSSKWNKKWLHNKLWFFYPENILLKSALLDHETGTQLLVKIFNSPFD